MSFGTAGFQFLCNVQLGSYSLFDIHLCSSSVHLEDEICTLIPAHKTHQFNRYYCNHILAMHPSLLQEMDTRQFKVYSKGARTLRQINSYKLVRVHLCALFARIVKTHCHERLYHE